MEKHLYKNSMSVKGEQTFRVPSDCFLIDPLPVGGTYNFCIASIIPGLQNVSTVKQIKDPSKYTFVNTHIPMVEVKITGVPADHTFHIKYN